MSKQTSQSPADWREARRLRAWELSQAGWTQSRIAAAFGVTQGAVSQWISRGRAGGEAGLRTQPRPGAPRKLGTREREQLRELLAQGAEAHGFVGAIWTCPRVAELIARRWGVSYHPSHVGRILRALGWSPQRPKVRATQRDAAVVATWVANKQPALKKSRGGGAARALRR
jgi:transposase